MEFTFGGNAKLRSMCKMKKTNRVISLILCICLLLSFAGCSAKDNVKLPLPSVDYWQDVPDDKGESSDIWKNGEEPNINITVIGGNKELTDKEEQLSDGAKENISLNTMIYNAVQADLNAVGFSASIGYAFSDKDVSKNVSGVYYYTEDFDMRAANDMSSCGFVEVLPERIKTKSFNADDVVYVVDPSSATGNKYVYDYDYQNIGPYHLVYKNKYIVYYTESDGIVRYEVKDNDKSNYDLSLGSLYNYDTDTYIYDESIYGEYKNHSGESLFGKENYEKLENELKNQVEKQKEAGYNVEEYQIVYISSKAIQAYIDSEEEATFFGYNVDSLTEAFGLGTALVYEENGFVPAKIIKPEESGYNWKSFLIKCGIGCGIILVGAILTPITGGTSFGCALVTISKFAVNFALSSAIGTLAIETVTGLIRGESITDSLKNATHRGLDAFANGFMIGAVVGSVGVVTGVIKPTACFVAGTPIVMATGAYKTVEEVSLGDFVLSYDEVDGQVSTQKVTDVFNKEVYQTIDLTINGEHIETTYNHPFYSSEYQGWIPAGKLKKGDGIVNDNGDVVIVQSIETKYYSQPIIVYNFTVENTHTYFVGTQKLLVHNSCQNLTKEEINSARSKAGRTAKKQALNDLKGLRDPQTGKIRATDLREWAAKWGLDMTDPNDMKIANFVAKNNRFPSFRAGDGFQCDFAHAIDVNKIVKSYNKGLISKEQAISLMSNSNNGILTSRTNHYLYHGGNWSNITNLQMIVKARPTIEAFVNTIAKLIAA